ncbi:MAG: DUF452 family protein [Chlorobiaceae bacterium]|nr:DUF452 family protein [Chlorobiaceae bacterium]
MKAEWIVRDGRDELLLFFNGWGMDRALAEWLRSEKPGLASHDLVVLYDYSDLTLPEELRHAFAGYREIDLVAWSLGVWAALHADLDRVRRAVALNGTPFPIDDARGIPPAVFNGTLENWSDATRSRFERRMFAGFERDPRVGQVRSARSSQEQQDELRSIAAAAISAEGVLPAPWEFSRAVIGSRDLIFLPEHQQAAWQGIETMIVDDMPHFPFFHLHGWQEALA